MPVEGPVLGDFVGGNIVGIGHEVDRGRRAVFPRQIKRMLAAGPADPEAGIAGGHMDEDGLGGAVDHVLKRGRVHEQLPVVLMGGEIERDLVGPHRLRGAQRRRLQGCKNAKTNRCDPSR